MLAIVPAGFAAAALATALLIRLLSRGAVLADIPNHRSSHNRTTPRGGGIGILVGLAAALALNAALGGPPVPPALLGAAGMVALAGLADDLRPLPAAVRFLIQIAAAVVAVWSGAPLSQLPLPSPLDLPLGWLSAPLSVLWIVGTLNVYNFLDGIDGYAALQTVIAGLAVALMRLDPASEVLGLALAAGSAGFLIHNWHPARIFMGDVGSTTIGFLLAAMPMYLPAQRQPRAVFAIGICLWFFLADGALTMIRRMLRRERFWEPHRSHLYQQLVIAGVQHDAVVTRVGAMAVPLSGLAVLAARSSQDWLLWLSFLCALLGLSAYLRWVRLQRARAA